MSGLLVLARPLREPSGSTCPQGGGLVPMTGRGLPYDVREAVDAVMNVLDEDALPWPGEELVHRVTGDSNRERFYASGQQSVTDIEAALAVIGRRLDQCSTILDFGSGCGRILMWMRALGEQTALHGTDIDARAIGWAEANLPWARFQVNQPLPPLDYPDGHFDLVFSSSVFTHIDEDYQDQWLAELRRITRPGGHVLLSIHGEPAFAEYEWNLARAGGDASPTREALSRDGIAFLREDPYVGGPFPDFYHTTFHAPWYVFAHWGLLFTIKAYLPRRSVNYQDFVLLERTVEGAGVGQAPPPIQVTGVRPAAGAGGSTAPTGSTEPQPSTALAEAVALLERGPDASSPTRWGRASVMARKAVQRAVRHHDEHQQRVNRQLVEALRDLEARIDARTTSGGTSLSELNAKVWVVLANQGERVNRLEAELLSELRDLSRRVAADRDEG